MYSIIKSINDETKLADCDGVLYILKKITLDEVELVKKLMGINCENVVKFYGTTAIDGDFYAVEEYINGVTLKAYVEKKGALSDEDVQNVAVSVCNGLSAVHSLGIVHRDINPNNIMLDGYGVVKIIDFGISRTYKPEMRADTQILGTQGYAAPEQYSVEMWQSTATDVYALAAVLYRCVTGTTPPDAEQRRSYDTLESAYSLNNGVPQQVSRAISLAMLVNSRERTQTMDRFLESLFEEPPTALRESKAATTEVPVQRGRASYPVSPVPTRADRTSRKVDPPPEPEKRGLPWYGIVLVVLAITAVCAVMYMVGKELLSEMPGSGEPGVSDSSPLEGEVPNYVGQNVNEIEKNETLFTYSYEFVVDADSSENTIIRQSPEPGTLVRSQDGEKTAVTLYVSRGRRVEMIGVVGNTVEQAQSALSALGIRSICIDEETASYLPGTVLRQSLEEGALVDPNSQTVTLYVASAPPPAEPEDEEQPEAGA